MFPKAHDYYVVSLKNKVMAETPYHTKYVICVKTFRFVYN